jgi:hypothetical protein
VHGLEGTCGFVEILHGLMFSSLSVILSSFGLSELVGEDTFFHSLLFVEIGSVISFALCYILSSSK